MTDSAPQAAMKLAQRALITGLASTLNKMLVGRFYIEAREALAALRAIIPDDGAVER